MLENFTIGVIATLTGALLTWVSSVAYQRYKAAKGFLTSNWLQIIRDGEVEKEDLVKCRQIGSEISGSIIRQQPQYQKDKKWKFIGRIQGEKIFIVFWTADYSVRSGSYGTIQLHIMTDNELQGHYMKAVSERQLLTKEGEIISETPDRYITKFPIIHLKWKRVY